MDDEQFRLLLDCLGYSWRGFRRVRRGVKKRIRRHMRELGCHDIHAYLEQMAQRTEIRHECELLMTVPISRFFRDRHMWQLLKDRWIPGMLAGKPEQFIIWSAGCACGEEVYSAKMVWEHLLNDADSLPALHIFATDRDPERIERARSGVYNRSSLKDVSSSDRTVFFDSLRGGKRFAVKNRYKTGIDWEVGNLLTDLFDRRFQIIFLRNNILTYCRQGVHMNALKQILNGLAPRGLLILGCHERLPPQISEMVPVRDCLYVYRKR